METVKIEGIAEISERGFHFDSGMPSEEPVLEEALQMRGTLRVSENACVDFVDNGRVYLPPEIHSVSSGEGYNVKRTTRHYLIQLKVPVVESRAASEARIREAVPILMGDIVLDRKELLGSSVE